MKYFLGVLLVGLCAAFGYKISEKYEIRKVVFDSLCIFNSAVISETACETPFSEIMRTVPAELKDTFDGAENLLAGNPFVCNNKALCARQRKLVEKYVTLLGKYDKEGQRELLLAFGKTLEAEKKICDEDARKASGTGLKTGFALGIAAFILIV